MSEKEPVVPISEKCAFWLKTHPGFIIGLTSWAALLLIVFFVGNIRLSDRIQAASMITLVFITLFYAVQTQALVREEQRALEEERDKRIAEYGEKRITLFLTPLKNKLNQLKDDLSIIARTIPNEPIISKWDDVVLQVKSVAYNPTKQFFLENAYMSNDILTKKMLQFFNQIDDSWPTLDHQDDAYVIPWKEKMEKAITEIGSLVGVEIQIISTHIKRTYGFYVKMPLSWDDAILPPADPPK